MVNKPVKHHSVKFTPQEMADDGPTPAELRKWKVVGRGREAIFGIASDENDAERLPIIGRGVTRSECFGQPPLLVKYVVVDESSVGISLRDGRKVSAPLEWYPRLKHAAPAERNDWRIIMEGRVVSWHSLGLAISAKALLEGTKASESPAALKKWLDSRKSSKRKTA